MPLPVPPDYHIDLGSRSEMAAKCILPPALHMILNNKYYPLSVRQAPLHPQQQKIPSCSPSPMPCSKSESLRKDQTKSLSFGTQADGRKEEKLETSLEVQPDDMTGSIGTGSTTRWSDHKIWRKRTQGGCGRHFARRSGKLFFSSRRWKRP